MGIQSTQTVTREYAESRLKELLMESSYSNRELVGMIKYPTKRSELIELVLKMMNNEQMADLLEKEESNKFYNCLIKG